MQSNGITRLLARLAGGAAITACAWSAGAAEPIAVFGLPLGGEMPKLLECPKEYSKRTVPCWTERSSTPKSPARSGSVWMPDTQIPSWVAYSSVNVQVNDSGALSVITVEPSPNGDAEETVASIAQRFGAPTLTSSTRDGQPFYVWRRSDIHILSYSSPGSCCTVIFTTAELNAKNEEAAAAARQRRPPTP